MSVQHYILATAGHVDHGKSALVKALTGTDPDRLPEEKARGITIDLGFARLRLQDGNRADWFEVGIVDVPGHEDFVKNMVAGVGSIDVALLVVAADDGWMPQTEEHFQILNYLGVTRGVVALTKIDLAQNEETAIAGVREKLAGSPLTAASIVPTSVVTGRGIDELKAALAMLLAQTPPPRDYAKPRLQVDRVFVLRGIGTVVTGTLSGGTLQRGQSAVIQPRGQSARVRAIQNHNVEVESSTPGTRTALSLPDVAGGGDCVEGVIRGDVVTLAELGAASDTIDVVLEKSIRLVGLKSAPARPIKDGARVRIHHGSGNVPARVYFPEGGELEAGERRTAELRLESPMFSFVGDRFIVRDWPEQTTLGGGIVLDADARREQFRTGPQQEFLAARAQAPDDLAVLIRSQVARDGAVKESGVLLKSRFSRGEISGRARELAQAGEILVAGEWLALPTWWDALLRAAAGGIDEEHRAHPERIGLALSDLRATLQSKLPSSGLFDLLARELCRVDFVQSGNAIRRKNHFPALPPQLQNAGKRIRAALASKPLDPPSRKELAPDAASQQALRFLIQTGEAVELGPEIVLQAEGFARAMEIVKAELGRAPASVSELRQALGSSRRVVVPLLERLDRDGVTLRRGDVRVLRGG